METLRLSEWYSDKYGPAPTWLTVPAGAQPLGVARWNELAVSFFTEHHTLFVALAVAYLPVLAASRYAMRSRAAFELRRPLQCWNAFMCIFSGIGAALTVPAALLAIGQMSPDELICGTWCFGIRHGVMVFLFNVSKVIEFVDTVFIVLRKRPLIFLHYYHHVVTMLFCWFTNQTTTSYGHACAAYYFATMNFLVHFVMYGYYWARSCGYKPTIDAFITSIQIAQMVIGVLLLCIASRCDNPDHLWLAYGFIMYASFFFMFAKLFAKRYLGGSKAPTARPKKA